MPNRTITEAICASRILDSLTPEEERLFGRLKVHCDDYGRFFGRAAVIIGRCFPGLLDLGLVSVQDVERWLQGLDAKGAIHLYEVDGERYLFVDPRVWEQTPRAKASKHPAPAPTSNPPPAGADHAAGATPPVPSGSAGQGAVPDVVEERGCEASMSDQGAPVRQTRWYREFAEVCDANGMQQWCAETPFLQLYRAITGTAGRDPAILIDVATEAALSARDTPGPTYGLRIIQNLPGLVRTREDAKAHFEARRATNGAQQKPGGYAPTQGAGDNAPPPDDEDDPVTARARRQTEQLLRKTDHAAAS